MGSENQKSDQNNEEAKDIPQKQEPVEVSQKKRSVQNPADALPTIQLERLNSLRRQNVRQSGDTNKKPQDSSHLMVPHSLAVNT